MQPNLIARLMLAAALLSAGALTGCVTYLTPGAPAAVADLNHGSGGTDGIDQPGKVPAFPVRIAIARIQAPGYRSFDVQGIGKGPYSLVVQAEAEKASDFDALRDWPQVLGVAPVSQLVVSEPPKSFEDLRKAAAAVQADVLFVYTFNTVFHIETKPYPPQQSITLGVLPGREAGVTTTASGLFVDVDTGYVYGVAEGSGLERTLMSKWTRPSAADDTRLSAERQAFQAMMGEARQTWDGIVAHYAPNSALAMPETMGSP